MILSRHRERPARLRYQLLALAAARTVVNTVHRMVYPFLPRMARGLGVELETMALIVTARSALGLVGPLFGSLGDRIGRKAAMISGLLVLAAAMLLVTLWPTYPALFAALVIASAAKLIYDPAMHAFVGDRVHYTQRGLAIAITELSWSGAFLIGVPIVGWLIARTDHWYAPLPLLAVLSVLAAVLLWVMLPAERVHPGERPSLVQGLRIVIQHRAALAGLSISLLISSGNELISIVFGAWMEEAFALEVAALGAAAAVIGVAELGGEGLVGGFSDRLGKRRSVAVGIALNAAACLLLPALGFALGGALVGLFVLYITFEFALVSTLPIMTELVPGARATLLAGNMAVHAIGRMSGALVGPLLFSGSILPNALGAALCNLGALAVLLIFIRPD